MTMIGSPLLNITTLLNNRTFKSTLHMYVDNKTFISQLAPISFLSTTTGAVQLAPKQLAKSIVPLAVNVNATVTKASVLHVWRSVDRMHKIYTGDINK